MTEQQSLHNSLQDADQVPELWRNEVQARLERYKRRRGRRIEGAFTMRFPFPPEEPAVVASHLADAASIIAVEEPEPTQSEIASSDDQVPLAADAGQSSDHAASEAFRLEADANQPEPRTLLEVQISAVAPAPEPTLLEPEEVSPPVIEIPPRPRPRRKVIAFPSPSYAQQDAMRRLADPVQPEQLRILDVPEELQAIPATPFLEGLLDAPASVAPATAVDAIDLPCTAAQTSTRLGAALIDTVAVLAGMAAFIAAAGRFISHSLPPMKFLIVGGLAISVLLWASYQYLFLVYSGRTLGMTVTRICLRTFKGRSLTFRQRQSRVMALYLSVLSLGMGVLWSFVDVDGLCWHDRISQTFPALSGKS